jgi:leucyl aminopeptidase
MKIAFAPPPLPQDGVVVVLVMEDRRLSPAADALDLRLSGGLRRAIETGRFKGKKDQTLALPAPVGTDYKRVLLLGVGNPAELSELRMQGLGGQVAAALADSGGSAFVAVDPLPECPHTPAAMAALMAEGAQLRSYRFDRYFTKEKDEDKPSLSELTFGCEAADEAEALYAPRARVAQSVAFTRDLVSEPANVIYPETFAAAARTLTSFGLEVEVLGEADMRLLGMGALLGVSQGSEREAQLVVISWWGLGKPSAPADLDADDPRRPLAFIGKGVTFDSGGISIKPSANMEDMKWDMAGAGAVAGLLRALAAREAKVNAVGVAGLVENMPSGTAQRPGDVVTSMSGQTIEVINTDAEGRLVLCDALHYTRERFKPRLMVDLATLTGAIIIALGEEKAGLFANNDELAERLTAAGLATGEPLWRMPLGDEYDKIIKSDIADMKNVGNRGGGSITAAQFLQRFVGDTPWAHLDIAGMAWSKKDRDVVPKGASGFGIRLLDRFVADHYEQR